MMHTKRRKICEVLLSTVIVSVVPVTLFWSYAVIRGWNGQMEAGRLVIGFLYGIVMGLLAMGIYIVPSAFLVSLLIVYLKRWSFKAAAMLLVLVVICSSVSAYLSDPTGSLDKEGSIGYFIHFDWFISQFNLIAVITGFIGALIAFWAVHRCRQCRETLAEDHNLPH
jgi:hypothetical protein